MKKTIITICGVFALLVCCKQATNAQEPSISKSYKEADLPALIASFYHAQTSDILSVNEAITNSFKKDFPNVKKVEWESGSNFYEAEFEIKNTDYNAFYNAKGNLLLYYFDITRSAVPQQIKNAAKALYKDYRLDDAEKIVTAYGIKYKVVMERGEMEETVFFNEDGTAIKF